MKATVLYADRIEIVGLAATMFHGIAAATGGQSALDLLPTILKETAVEVLHHDRQAGLFAVEWVGVLHPTSRSRGFRRVGPRPRDARTWSVVVSLGHVCLMDGVAVRLVMADSNGMTSQPHLCQVTVLVDG